MKKQDLIFKCILSLLIRYDIVVLVFSMDILIRQNLLQIIERDTKRLKTKIKLKLSLLGPKYSIYYAKKFKI